MVARFMICYLSALIPLNFSPVIVTVYKFDLEYFISLELYSVFFNQL